MARSSKVWEEIKAIVEILSRESGKHPTESSARGRLDKAARLVERGEYRRARTLIAQVAAHSRSEACERVAEALTAILVIEPVRNEWDHAAGSLWSSINDWMDNCCDDAQIEKGALFHAWRAIAQAALKSAPAA